MALSEHSIQQKIEKSNTSCPFLIGKPATAGYPAVAGFFYYTQNFYILPNEALCWCTSTVKWQF